MRLRLVCLACNARPRVTPVNAKPVNQSAVEHIQREFDSLVQVECPRLEHDHRGTPQCYDREFGASDRLVSAMRAGKVTRPQLDRCFQAAALASDDSAYTIERMETCALYGQHAF